MTTSLWGEFESPDPSTEEVIPAEIVKIFIMKAMQPDSYRNVSIPKRPDKSVRLDVTDSETIGLEIDDKVIHSIKLIQHAKEMSQLIEAAKEQTELMADTQIHTFPPALEIPIHPIKTPKWKINNPIQYMDKDSSDFTLGRGPKIPEISKKTAKQLLKKSVAALLAHAGYQTTKESILNTLADVVEEYICKMTGLLRIAVDQGANTQATGFPDAMERVFHEMNIGSIRCIHDYYQNRIINYRKRLLLECKTLNAEYNNISIPIKTESFAMEGINKLEEPDDVPEIHFPALGEEGVDELQPSLEPGFQMLQNLEQEAQLQTMDTQEDDGNVVSDSPSQETVSEVVHTNKRRRRI